MLTPQPRDRQATAADNRAAARREAARLLALVLVPPGAVRVGSAPRLLTGPALGTPGARSLVDQKAMWRVSLPFHAVERWLAAHRPAGLPPDGSMSSGTVSGGTNMTGRSYRGPGRAAWASAELEIGVAEADHGGSVIRADAVIVWLDPRPVRYGPGAHPVRVTLAGGCPRSDRGVTGVINPGGGLSQRLLPTGSPTAGLVCRYYGMNGRPFRLRAGQRLDALAARRLARSMALLPLSHVDGGVWHCGMDDGSAEVVALAYSGHPDVDLWVKLNGCGLVSNGHIATGIAAWLTAST